VARDNLLSFLVGGLGPASFLGKALSMFRAWKVGRLAGIDIYIHWSLLLVPLSARLAGAADVESQSGHSMMVMLLALLPAIYTCVLLHEFGHALMARRFGLETPDITLTPLGGVARLTNPGQGQSSPSLGSPRQELWITLAGPAVNVVIALGLFLLDLVVDFNVKTFLGEFAFQLFWINVVLAVFNMMPFFPMDGGRVLRALLAAEFGQLVATEVATKIGFVIAVLFVWAGVNSGNVLLILISIVIYFLGQQELVMLRLRAAREQASAEGWPVRRVAVDGSAAPPETRFNGFTFDQRNRVWVLWRDGRPIHGCALE
jgi:Zn-dependent protease